MSFHHYVPLGGPYLRGFFQKHKKSYQSKLLNDIVHSNHLKYQLNNLYIFIDIHARTTDLILLSKVIVLPKYMKTEGTENGLTAKKATGITVLLSSELLSSDL